MRRCTKCGADKPHDAFSPAKAARDGLNSWCKRCKADRERERRAADPEASRRKDRERYLDGRHGKAYARENRAANPERNRARARAHYWRHRETKIVRIHEAKLERVGGRGSLAYMQTLVADPCAYCGERGDTVDHIEPLGAGGDDGWANLTAACRGCNARKTDKPLLVFLAHRNGCYEWRRDIPPVAA